MINSLYLTPQSFNCFSVSSNKTSFAFIAAQKAKEVLFDLTKQQLDEWGVKYNELIMGKPHADYFIDDKGVKDEDFFK